MIHNLSRAPAAAVAVLAVAVVSTVAACSPASPSSASNGSAAGRSAKNVTIQIDGSAAPYYAPLYEAKDQGYFARHGLNVSFSYAQGASILQNVAAGNVTFGFPNGDSVVTAYGKGVLVKVVHTTYQQGIGALLAKASAHLNSPADLKGKTVAVTSLGSPNYLQLQAMLKSANLSLTDVKVKVIGTGAIVPALRNGQVDAIVFSRLRYYSLRAARVDVTEILSDNFLPSFGNVVVAAPSTVAHDAGEVKAFDDALDEGIQYTIGHPAEAVDAAIKEYAPSFDGQQKVITQTIEDVYAKQLWVSSATQAHGLGYGDLNRWQQAIDAQVSYKLIGSSYPAGDLVVEPGSL